MANKRFWLGILAVMLVFGMVVIACSDGGSSNQNSNDETWEKGDARLILSGNNYTFKSTYEGGATGVLYETSKGTFTADLSASSGTFDINQTHQINVSNGQLEANIATINGNFSLTGNTLVLSDFPAYFNIINGTWTKQ